MKKKQYIQPTCEAILLKASQSLLAGSFGSDTTPKNMVFEDGYYTEDTEGDIDPE